MCRVAKVQLDAGTSAPRAARAWMTGLLERWEATHLSETANLLASELVSNAVRHTQSGPSITAAIVDGFLEVGVNDGRRDKVPQIFCTDDLTAEHGRGLPIVEALAAEWGTTLLPKGKQVWFRLDASGWTYLTACRCKDDHADQVVLDSGRPVLANSGPWDDVRSG